MGQLQTPRIAILGTRGVPAAYGGFETFAEELSMRLANRGVDVTVFCVATEVGGPTFFHDVRLEYVPDLRLGPLTTVLFDVRCLWRARKKYDVVYMLGYGAAAFCFLPRLYGVKVWINADGVEWMRAKWGRIAKAYFRAMEFFTARVPNRVIADAEAIRTHLLSRHGPLPTCAVIPYGAPIVDMAPDTSVLNQWGVRPKQYHLVVCRMEPENHVREIIEGFCASDSRFPLVVVGNIKADTDYGRALLALSSERVRLIGAVYDKANLQALRYHSLAYFHGHSVGGTNPSLLEAMGCGNLVIAHDNAFNREVLGPDGWFFEGVGDIPGLVAVVESLGDAQEAAIRLCVKERTRSEYSWERIVDAYLDLLHSECAANEPGRW